MVLVNFSIKSDSSGNSTLISLNDININETVQSVKKKLATTQNVNSNDMNFVHHGQILRDEEVLHKLGICSGSVIFCFTKPETKLPTALPLSLIEFQQLLVSLRSAISNPGFKLFIEKLRTSEQIEKLVNECPALKKDPSSLAYILDADLILSLQNADHLSKVVDERPVIGRILQIVCNLIVNEIPSPKLSHHVSYSMDALSDEEMEIDQSEVTYREQRTGSSSFQPITPAQLAAALANAAGSSGFSNWGGPTSSTSRNGRTPPSSVSTPFNTPAPPSGSGTGGGASPGGPLITTEMFSQAFQNALAASASSSSDLLTGASPTVNAPLPTENLEESLQLMREMGILDEELGIQALQATNGDVQAAVNLIFAQYMADI